MIAIRLDPEIEEQRTKTYYAREAILEHLEDLEGTYLAIERLETPEKLSTLEEAKCELGL